VRENASRIETTHQQGEQTESKCLAAVNSRLEASEQTFNERLKTLKDEYLKLVKEC
jgi:hypothetical protein